MALRYLLDTNVVSEWVKPVPDPGVMARLQRHHADCAIAAPTLQELAFGFSRLPPSRRRDQLEWWLTGLAQRLPVLPLDATAAWWLGVERAAQAQRGRSLPYVDGEIAAIAVGAGLTLVTRNLKDFEGLGGLSCVSWHQDTAA